MPFKEDCLTSVKSVAGGGESFDGFPNQNTLHVMLTLVSIYKSLAAVQSRIGPK